MNFKKDKKMKVKFLPFLLMLLLTLPFSFTACEDKDEDEDEIENPVPGTDDKEKTNNEITNEWIYDVMEKVYLWNDKLASSPNYKDNPESFFYNILYKYGSIEGDLFSWIEEDKSKGTKSSSLTGNLGFTYIPAAYFESDVPGAKSFIGFFVTSVQKGSDAETKGLKRGHLIYAVDNTVISGDNYLNILKKGSFTLSIYNEFGKVTLDPISANAASNSPVILSKIIEEDGIKIGYLVYDAFERGIGEESEKFKYDIELIDSIGKLKSRGVTEFVLDLRYNPGGYLTSAMALASALVPQANAKDIFLKEEYNTYFQDSLVAKYGRNSLNEYFLDKIYGTNVAIPNLNLSRLYVIATENSASASEAVINGLKPYMEVHHIGLRTVGKDKASMTIKSDDKRVLWQLQPIISRLTNSKGEGNYIHGLKPSYEISEWEKSFAMTDAYYLDGAGKPVESRIPLATPWKGGFAELGEKGEPLLAAAIAHITTAQFPVQSDRAVKSQSVRKRIPQLKRDESRFKTIIDSDKFDRLRKK